MHRDDDNTPVRTYDESHIELLYAEHGRYIQTLAKRLLGASASSSDLTQDAFMVAFRRLKKRPHPLQSPRKWLSAITIDLASNYRRTRWHKGFLSLGTNSKELPDSIDWYTPELAMREQQTVRELYRLMEKLPEAKRTVFVLYEVQGYNCGEIAELLECPLKTVHSRLCGARDILMRLQPSFKSWRGDGND